MGVGIENQINDTEIKESKNQTTYLWELLNDKNYISNHWERDGLFTKMVWGEITIVSREGLDS